MTARTGRPDPTNSPKRPNVPAFKVPIVIWLDPGDPSKGRQRISTPARGLACLHRYGLQALRSDPLWANASAALARARDEKAPEAVELARIAFEALARAAGCLAPAADPPR